MAKVKSAGVAAPSTAANSTRAAVTGAPGCSWSGVVMGGSGGVVTMEDAEE
jgi:hypothetical protein